MNRDHDERRIDTTLGELIEAVSEVAFEYSKDTKEAYTLARLVLAEIFRNSGYTGKPDGPLGRGSAGRNRIH